MKLFLPSAFHSFVNSEFKFEDFILQSTDRLSRLESHKLFQKQIPGEIKGEAHKCQLNHDNFNK